MSKTITGKNLASEFREKADKKQLFRLGEDVSSLFALAISHAQKAAENGEYSINVYDERLDNPILTSPLLKHIRSYGFTAKVYEDIAYSDHADKRIMCLEIKW